MNLKTKIRKKIVRNPRISVEELHDALEADEIKVSRLLVSSLRREFRSVLRFLDEQELLNEDGERIATVMHGTRKKFTSPSLFPSRELPPKRQPYKGKPKRTWWPDG